LERSALARLFERRQTDVFLVAVWEFGHSRALRPARTIRYFLAGFLRGVGAISSGYSARVIPILGSMASPPCSATGINASIAARHAKLSCSRFGSRVM
jgi:hypothetical protein